MRKNQPKVGDIILANSLCPCKIKIKISRGDELGWWGFITSQEDIKCLKDYSISLSLTDETFVFDFHVIKIIKAKSNYKRRKRRRNG